MRIPLGLTSLSWVTLWSSTSHWDIKGSRQISFPDEREEGLPQVDPFYSFPLCTRAWGLGLQSPFVTMKQQAWRWNTTCKRRQGIKIRKSYWPAMMGRQGHVPISGPMLGTGRIRVRKTETLFSWILTSQEDLSVVQYWTIRDAEMLSTKHWSVQLLPICEMFNTSQRLGPWLGLTQGLETQPRSWGFL